VSRMRSKLRKSGIHSGRHDREGEGRGAGGGRGTGGGRRKGIVIIAARRCNLGPGPDELSGRTDGRTDGHGRPSLIAFSLYTPRVNRGDNDGDDDGIGHDWPDRGMQITEGES